MKSTERLSATFAIVSEPILYYWNHRVHILVEMKQGYCICPLSHGAYTATLLVMVNVVKGVGVHPTLISLG